MKIIKHIFSAIVLIGIIACNNAPKQAQSQKVDTKPLISIPFFDKESAFQYVKAQTDFGPRIPGTKAHTDCKNYFVETLEAFGATVIQQDFKSRLANNEIVSGTNIIASFQPEKRNRVLLCAHWDSRPYADMETDQNLHKTPIDGANDGASGVGVLLEIGRLLSQQATNIGIDIILFDLEDWGEYGDNDSWALGSQYWSKNPHIPNYYAKYGILLDMVGTNNPTFMYEMTSYTHAPHILEKVWNTAHVLGYSQYFRKDRSGAILDDHVPVNENLRIPTIDIIHFDMNTSTGFFEHWHTIKDDINSIDVNTLDMVGRTVVKVIYEEK